MRPKRLKTVGQLREVIRDLPDDAPINSDVIESSTDLHTCGIVSAEAGVPKAWRGVKGVEPGLWFHCRIREM